MSEPRVLIIDDDPSVHDVVAHYLRLSGFGVLSAFDGQAGVDAARADPPDLILLDAQMPVMDGFRALSLLRACPAMAAVPILMVTSLGQTNLKVRGLELGADDYIVKPFDKAELLARVNRALRRGQAGQCPPEQMEGRLEDFGFAELLQTMDLGKKTGTVHLPDIGAEVRIRKGRLAGASWKRFAGREALLRILLIERGRFRVEFQPPEVPDDSEGSVQDALLESLCLQDEICDILGKAGSPGSTFRRAPGAEEAGAFVEIADRPAPALEVVASLEGDLKGAARLVAKAVAEGILIPV